jgi:uncharacterized protein YcaQ
MPRVGTPPSLDLSAARRIWLRAQRLDSREPFGNGPDAAAAAIAHLGYVQIDTINVIERCHHHILYTRIPAYRREHLHRAQTIDKSVFEYWTHALSYIPTGDFRFYVPAMRRHRREPHSWLGAVTRSELRRMLDRLRREGPLSIRDIEEDPVEKHHPWASRKPSKRVLQLAFYMGHVTISERVGMLKTYELTDRHFGWESPPKPASVRDMASYLLDRALRAQGVIGLDSVTYGDASWKPAVRKLIEARMRRKALVPVAIDGAGRQEHWAPPALLDAIPEAADAPVHILSPFDPLIIQRKRLRLFFGYDHIFEAYLPKEKRRYGYFALPVLVGEEIVAAIDLKTDRAAKRLLVQKWTWLDGTRNRALKRRIEEELDRFERFQLASIETEVD